MVLNIIRDSEFGMNFEGKERRYTGTEQNQTERIRTTTDEGTYVEEKKQTQC